MLRSQPARHRWAIRRSAFAVCVAGIVLSGVTGASLAATCEATLATDDTIRFIPAHIDVPASCVEFTVKLTHTGRLPKAAMAHNWVLVKKPDLVLVARDGAAAGADADYVMPGDKRVIAHSGIIGRGETTSLTFPVKELKAGVEYVFFCSFTGHSPVMQGTLAVKP